MKTEDVEKVLIFLEEAAKQYTEKHLLEANDNFHSWEYDKDGWIWLYFQDEDGEKYDECLRLENLVEWANMKGIK